MHGDYTASPSEKPNYYELLTIRGKAIDMWNKLNVSSIPQHYLQELKFEFFSALHEPFLPNPKLRREPYAFPTIIQDFLGNAFVPPNELEGSYSAPGLDILLDSIDILEENFMDSIQIQQLSAARWLLKRNNKYACVKRYSLASQSTASDTERGTSFLVSIILTIKASVKAHCKAVALYLKTFTEALSFLSAYCMMVIFI